MKYPKFLHSREVVPPPPQNIPFFAYLHELEKVKKKCENDPNLSRSPPHPKCEISPFFFLIEKVPNHTDHPTSLEEKEFFGHVLPSGLFNILNHKIKNIQFKTFLVKSEI